VRAEGTDDAGPTFVSERLRATDESLTAAERKVSRVLLNDYPLAGLDVLSVVAAKAAVSAPTVLRLVTKLGFDSYSAFQDALKRELAARLSSPLQMYPQTAPESTEAPEDVVQSFVATVAATTAETTGRILNNDLRAVVELLTRRGGRVLALGGQFSSVLAQYLVFHLQMLRPGVQRVSSTQFERANLLLDLSSKDVVVAFDYRRYQRDTIDFTTKAKEAGAGVVVFTDPYASSLASIADVALCTPVETGSPFDTLVPALALLEGVLAGCVAELGPAPRDRIEQYDRLVRGALEHPTPRFD